MVDACLTEANGHAERIAALHMIEPRADRPRPITLGADKAYDAEDFVNELRSLNATPHVAQNTNGRSSAIDGRTTRHMGYAISQRIRKRIEEAIGWIKTVAGQERTKFRGRERVGWAFTLAAAAYNLAAAEAPGGFHVKAPANCRLIGRWRIVEADLWDRAYLDLCGPATLTITARGGEIAFCALQAGLEVEYARDSIGFRWAGGDEGDQVEGEGTAKLLDDGTIEIEFAYHKRRRSRPQSQTHDFFNSQLERDANDLHGQERKMSSGGPRVAVERTRTVIAKKEAAWGGLESREETPKEGIYGREPAPQQCNAAMQQLRARFDVLFASRSGAPGHRTPLCRPRDTKTSLIARLPRSRAGVRGPARSWRSSQRGGYAEGPRLPSDRASLRVLATESRFFRTL